MRALRALRCQRWSVWTTLLASLVLVAPETHAGPVSPRLREALIAAGPDDLVPVVLLMEEFPQRRGLLESVRGMTRQVRRKHVLATMRELVERSQRPVRSVLAEEEAAGRVRDVRVLWGVNGLAVEASPESIERLAALSGVSSVLYDRSEGHREMEPEAPELAVAGPVTQGAAWSPDGAGESGPTGGDVSGPNPDATVEPQVVAMGAPQIWNELGYTGAGVIVAVIDTGLDPTHPDLADHIWTNLGEIPGNGVDDDGNGHVDDTWGWDFCSDTPPVVDSHGTQVAGQVAGDGTGGRVTGMAPDAELMSLGIDCDTPSRAWEASDYAIAHGADVITQSYSWWWTDRPDYEAFRRQTDVELAAGVIHTNSAGNHGASQATYPIPYNISAPANCPAPWIHPDQTSAGGVSSILGIGDINWSTDVIASSSSIGPSAWEDIQANTDPTFPHTNPPEYLDYPYENGAQMGLIKPDLSAYGTGTISTCPGPYYCNFSGTSSATPHVSGTVALMLQANPDASPEELAEALMTTAQHRGSPGKNNVYGTGLLQAFPAVLAVESGVIYLAHTIDDTAYGNGDGLLDPGEQVVMQVTVESRTDVPIDGLEAILSTSTPGVTIHDHHAVFPTLPARGTATSLEPHFSLSVAVDSCTTVVAFDLELRYAGTLRRSTFHVRVGEPQQVMLLDDGFESDLGWTSDPVAATQGFWVREDPLGVLDGMGRLSNPEDDTSPSGAVCWVTGNGELTGRKDENNNDVDGGPVILLSPPFGRQHMLSLTLSYDRWYYDVDSGNRLRVEVSNDGGLSWSVLENLIFGEGGWRSMTWDLFALLPPTDDMRLRFWAEDDFADDPVEAAVDEVRAEGVWVDCQDWAPPPMQAPNPVGATLRAGPDPGGHVVLTWQAPPVDASHDGATLFRIERALGPQGPWTAVGSATSTRWVDVDALDSDDPFHYRVTAENSGGSE